MTVPTLLQLITPVSAPVIFEQSLQVARDLELPETAWQAISIGREVIYINAQIASNFSVTAQAGIAAGGFLTYAQGAWLTLCAFEIFDTTRIESSSATGIIGLVNATAVPYAFGVGDIRVLNETSGKTYTNQTAGVLGALGPNNTIQFVADEPGSASSLVSTDVLSLVTTVPGITPQFIEELIGQDEEGPEALRIRSREANAKASPNGPQDAYDYYAKTTVRPDGSAVGVTRTNKVQGNGTTTLYLADADGALTTTDRGYVFDNVNANVVPTGLAVVIPDPSCSELSIDIAPRFTPNPESTVPQATTEAAARAAVVAYFASIPVGGDKAQSFQGVYLSTLNQIMRDAAGSAVLNLVLVTPGADVALLSQQIPVLGNYTPGWTS